MEEDSQSREVVGDCHLRRWLAENHQKKGWVTATGGSHGAERRRRKKERESNLSLLGANEV